MLARLLLVYFRYKLVIPGTEALVQLLSLTSELTLKPLDISIFNSCILSQLPFRFMKRSKKVQADKYEKILDIIRHN